MLSEPISFTGLLTLDDTLDLHRYHFRYLLGWPVRILMAATSLFIGALVFWAARRSHFTPFIISVLVLCAYYPFGWLLHRRLAVMWRFRRHPEQFIEHTVTITNDSLSTRSVRADIRFNWDCLAAIVSTSRGLLFLLPPHSIWFWLPQRLFRGNSYKDAILTIAKAHKVVVREMA